MKPRFIQENCTEGNRVDLRQARVVVRYRPDIIFFELPAEKGNPSLLFNHYGPLEKPLKEVERIQRRLKIAARKYPYALSDVHVWENIEKLWRENHDVLLFNIDGPDELRRDYHRHLGAAPYDSQKKHLIFWAHCYLREIQMAKHIRRILKNYQKKSHPIVAVFLQSIHWQHVRFLLKNPSQKKIWHYYFGRFPKINPANIGREIKKESTVHYTYWKKQADFDTGTLERF
jgi:hypothetical protein